MNKRFSLLGLFAVIALIALGIAALASGSDLWKLLSQLALFCGGAVSGVYAALRGRRAAFAIGFTIALVAKATFGPYTNDLYRDILFDQRYEESLRGEDAMVYTYRTDNRGQIADNLVSFGLAALVGVFAQWLDKRDRTP